MFVLQFVLLRTSSIPIGRTPGFLSRGIRRHELYAIRFSWGIVLLAGGELFIGEKLPIKTRVLSPFIQSKYDEESKVSNQFFSTCRFCEVLVVRITIGSNHDCKGFYMIYLEIHSDDFLWHLILRGKQKKQRTKTHPNTCNIRPEVHIDGEKSKVLKRLASI